MIDRHRHLHLRRFALARVRNPHPTSSASPSLVNRNVAVSSLHSCWDPFCAFSTHPAADAETVPRCQPAGHTLVGRTPQTQFGTPSSLVHCWYPLVRLRCCPIASQDSRPPPISSHTGVSVADGPEAGHVRWCSTVSAVLCILKFMPFSSFSRLYIERGISYLCDICTAITPVSPFS